MEELNGRGSRRLRRGGRGRLQINYGLLSRGGLSSRFLSRGFLSAGLLSRWLISTGFLSTGLLRSFLLCAGLALVADIGVLAGVNVQSLTIQYIFQGQAVVNHRPIVGHGDGPSDGITYLSSVLIRGLGHDNVAVRIGYGFGLRNVNCYLIAGFIAIRKIIRRYDNLVGQITSRCGSYGVGDFHPFAGFQGLDVILALRGIILARHIAASCKLRVGRPKAVLDHHIAEGCVTTVFDLNGVGDLISNLNGCYVGSLLDRERRFAGFGLRNVNRYLIAGFIAIRKIIGRYGNLVGQRTSRCGSYGVGDGQRIAGFQGLDVILALRGIILARHIAASCKLRVGRPKAVLDHHIAEGCVTTVFDLNGVGDLISNLNGCYVGSLLDRERRFAGFGRDLNLGIGITVAVDVRGGRVVNAAVLHILRRYLVGVGNGAGFALVKASHGIRFIVVQRCVRVVINLDLTDLARGPHVVGDDRVYLCVASVGNRDFVGQCISLGGSIVRPGHAGDGLGDLDLRVVDGDVNRGMVRCSVITRYGNVVLQSPRGSRLIRIAQDEGILGSEVFKNVAAIKRYSFLILAIL